MPSIRRRAVDRSYVWLLVSAWLVNLTWAGAAAPNAMAGPTLKIEVDARDLPRRLLHTRIHVPCRPGKLALWFPKWVPGAHGPLGPVQDVEAFASRRQPELRWRGIGTSRSLTASSAMFPMA